tara:strand:+ start:464 stop:745 length:282 start_codon:yes stop_codon:yes gene_type:complete
MFNRKLKARLERLENKTESNDRIIESLFHLHYENTKHPSEIDQRTKNMSNKKAEFAVEILKEYAHQNKVILRSTSDLSKLEEWLIVELLKVKN